MSIKYIFTEINIVHQISTSLPNFILINRKLRSHQVYDKQTQRPLYLDMTDYELLRVTLDIMSRSISDYSH